MAVVGRKRLLASTEILRKSVEEVFDIVVSPKDVSRLISKYGLRSYLILSDEEATVLEELVVEGRSSWGSRHA